MCRNARKGSIAVEGGTDAASREPCQNMSIRTGLPGFGKQRRGGQKHQNLAGWEFRGSENFLRSLPDDREFSESLPVFFIGGKNATKGGTSADPEERFGKMARSRDSRISTSHPAAVGSPSEKSVKCGMMQQSGLSPRRLPACPFPPFQASP